MTEKNIYEESTETIAQTPLEPEMLKMIPYNTGL